MLPHSWAPTLSIQPPKPSEDRNAEHVAISVSAAGLLSGRAFERHAAGSQLSSLP